MTSKGQYFPERQDEVPADESSAARTQVSHIAILRAARVRHKAIARGLQRYYDDVVAEPVPNELLNLLNPAQM